MQKEFEKMQHPFMIEKKPLNNLRMKKNIYLINGIY